MSSKALILRQKTNSSNSFNTSTINKFKLTSQLQHIKDLVRMQFNVKISFSSELLTGISRLEPGSDLKMYRIKYETCSSKKGTFSKVCKAICSNSSFDFKLSPLRTFLIVYVFSLTGPRQGQVK